MEVRALAEVAIVGDDGGVTPVTSPARRIILAVLVAHPGRPVRADVLVDALWDDPPPSADTSLRSQVSRLRSVLGDRLAITPAGYVLDVDSDVARIDAAAATVGASAADPAGLLTATEPLVHLLEVEPFAGLGDVSALEMARARLVEQLRSIRLARSRALLAVGRAGEAVPAARSLVEEDPCDEGAWSALVEALAADDRGVEAVRAAAQARAALAEVGLEPGDSLLRAEAAALRGPSPTPARATVGLPSPASSLIGRDDEVADLVDVLGSHRLVTLVGPGGVGKTRLAVEVARRCGASREWGARLVSLESIDDPRDVAAAVLDGLDLSAEAATPLDRLRNAGALDLLVVLDNCEHVIDAAAEVAAALVEGGAGVSVLASSRERLALPAERVAVVDPLPPESDGCRLFLDRAEAVAPASDLDDPATVARIVERVDGLPLAIEMAASQLGTTTLAALADDLERDLAHLAGATRGVPDRQRSLADLLAWTSARLDAPDRELLAEVAVFSGPVTADAVQAVTGRAGTAAGLRRLAARSLLRLADLGGEATFAMGAVVRAGVAASIAPERRAELDAAHLRHHLALADAASARLATAHQGAAVAQLDRMLPELRSAHRWAMEHDVVAAVALAGALARYGRDQIRLEVLGWADEVATAIESGLATGADPGGVATVLGTAAQFAVLRGDLDEGRRLAESGVAVPGAGAANWVPREVLSDVALFQGDLEGAVAVASAEPVPADPNLALRALLCVLLPAVYRGDTAQADRHLELVEALDLVAPTDLAWAAFCVGEARVESAPVEAERALQRAVELADQVSDRYVGGVARVARCAALCRHADPAAIDEFEDALDHWRRQGASTHLLITLRNLPPLLHRLDLPVAAAELLGTLAADRTTPRWGPEGERLATVEGWVADVLDPDELARATAAGAERDLMAAAAVAKDVLRGVARPPG